MRALNPGKNQIQRRNDFIVSLGKVGDAIAEGRAVDRGKFGGREIEVVIFSRNFDDRI